MLTPPLAWVAEMGASMTRAVGVPIRVTVSDGGMPLVHKVLIELQTPQPMSVLLPMWNVAQTWIARNEAVVQGSVTMKPTRIEFSVGVRRRLGPAKNEKP